VAIDINAAIAAIVIRLAPIRVQYQVEINAKDAQTYGEVRSDSSIAIISQGKRRTNNENNNNIGIVVLPIQLLYRIWNPNNNTEIEILLRAVDRLLDRWEPVPKSVRPLEWQSENPVQVQGLEGRQAYQQLFQFEVLK